ncbi:MAG: hypothetical protein ABIY55_12745 [Kofleriaceae bacterium]
MKVIMALSALSVAITASFALTSASAASKAVEQPGRSATCPPTVYECCDGTAGARPFCMSHGGACGVVSICGTPV